jgi:acyl-CoA synthetase (NDP forming)
MGNVQSKEQPNRYANGKIYKLVNDIDGEIYVGSTCCPLSKRLYEHKKAAKKVIRRLVYKHLNDVGWKHVNIILIELYPCQNVMQLKSKEREIIERLKPRLNKLIPTRTAQEWRALHKEGKARYDLEYRQKNTEHISNVKRIKYQESKDDKKQQMNKYYNDNKEQFAFKNKEYRIENKEKIAQQQSAKVACECGCEVRKGGLARHKRTPKHQLWLQNQPSTSQV